MPRQGLRVPGVPFFGPNGHGLRLAQADAADAGASDFALSPSTITTAASVGDVVGTLSTSGSSAHNADFSLSTPTTTTAASVGGVIGTLS